MSSEHEASASAILDSLSNAVLLLDPSLTVTFSNLSAERLLGAAGDRLVGRPAGEFLSPELLGMAEGAMRLGTPRLGVSGRARQGSGEFVPVRANLSPCRGRRAPAATSAAPGALVVSFARLTSLDHRERRRLQAERLAAMGRLTEGVAHVVRNPLTGIAAGVEFLGRGLGGDAQQRDNVAAMLREVDRLDGLLEDMVRITHPPHVVVRPVPLEGLMREVASQLASQFPGRSVRVACEPRIGEPRLDGEQLRRALEELVRNALEAAPEGTDVEVCAALEPPEEPGAEEDGDGLALHVEVRDRGPGVSPSIRRAPFEPFRSTKAGSKGLGLFIAQDVAERHGGELQIRECGGEGTVVTLLLPWEIRDDGRD